MTPQAIVREMMALPAHAGPYKTDLSLTANELHAIRGALDLTLIDYRARHLPRKTAYVERASRLLEKVDLAIAATQEMTTDLSKATALIHAMRAADRKAFIDLIDDTFCPDCGEHDPAYEHEEPCLRQSLLSPSGQIDAG